MMLSHNPIVEPFALAHATIVTGDKAGTILRNMTIVVGADGRIEQVAPSIETSIPAEYHYLDGTGKIVMPGLINAHTHLFSQGKPLNPSWRRQANVWSPHSRIRHWASRTWPQP